MCDDVGMVRAWRRRLLPGVGLLLAVALPTGVRAQDSTGVPLLTGVVVDTTGATIPLAQVIAVGNKKKIQGPFQVETTPRGGFTFPDLEEGTYTITVRRIGYVPIQYSVTLEEGEPKAVRFEMFPMPQRLVDVVTEVPRLPGERARDRTPLFRGMVVDPDGRPIANAEILAGGSTNRTRGPRQRETGTDGIFAFEDTRAGSYFITVRRIGYVPIRVALTVEKNTPRVVRFEMQPMPQGLPDIVVNATRFDVARVTQRVGGHLGTLLTRDDIKRLAPNELGEAAGEYLWNVDSDTFFEPALGLDAPRMRDVRYGIGPSGRAAASAFRARGFDCPPVISINGERPREGWALNDFEPEDVEAMEIYRSRDTSRGRQPVPLEFSTDPLYFRSCGSLVVVWLKAGRVVVNRGK